MNRPATTRRPHAFGATAGGMLAALMFALGCTSVPEGRTAVNEVQVRGARQVDESDILDKIATTETPRAFRLFRGFRYEYSLLDHGVLQTDLERVEAFYRSKGYYEAHARAGRVHAIDDNHVRVEIVVEEGAPVLVRKVDLDVPDGLPAEVIDAARRAASSSLPIRRPFVEGELTKAEANIRSALAERGYAYAEVTSEAAVDIVAHQVDVAFRLSPGPKCVLGEVRFVGLGTLPEAPVRRAAGLAPGAPYRESVLVDARQALLDLRVFAAVELVPELSRTHRDPVVPITVKVELTRLRRVRVGAGIELNALKTEVGGAVRWEHLNLFGGLRSFSVVFRPGVVFYPLKVDNVVAPTHLLLDARLQMQLRAPGFIEARTNALIRPELNVYPILLNPDPPPEKRVIGYAEVRGAFGVERTISRFFGSLSYNAHVDYPFVYVGRDDLTLDHVVIAYPELYTTFDLRDDRLRPRKGLFLANTMQVAGHVFGGDADDFKVKPEIRGYLPLSRRVVLAARAKIGVLLPQNYGSVAGQPSSVTRDRDYQLTLFRGFVSGGPTSNRGYPLGGIAPYEIVPSLNTNVPGSRSGVECQTDRCRDPTGGLTLWEASVEARISIEDPLSVVAFCDASDVSPQTLDFRVDHPHLSCGGGARYDTPVGPIRLDVAYRIPGMQVVGGLQPDDWVPRTFYGGLPIAVQIGIGETF